LIGVLLNGYSKNICASFRKAEPYRRERNRGVEVVSAEDRPARDPNGDGGGAVLPAIGASRRGSPFLYFTCSLQADSAGPASQLRS
jgi:hypothetical protein